MANPLYVALLFAGLFRGHEVTKMEFRRAVIRELQADDVSLHAYLAGYESDKLAWLNWYGNTTEYTWVTLPEDSMPHVLRLSEQPSASESLSSDFQHAIILTASRPPIIISCFAALLYAVQFSCLRGALPAGCLVSP